MDSEKCFGILGSVLDSGKCFGFWEVLWILGSVLDSGKCFGILERVLDSGKCFVVWEVFWIMGNVFDYGKCFVMWEVFGSVGSVFGFWEVFLDSGKCFGFWEVFWILGSVLSLWATIHIAPELSNGEKPTPSSDIYSFGYMYCVTMKEMKEVLGNREKELLELGKQMSHFRPQNRPQIATPLKELASLSTTL